MKIAKLLLLSCVLLLSALLLSAPLAAKGKKAAKPPQSSAAEKAMMEAWQKAAAVGPQHKRFEALTGRWNTEQTFWMDPKAKPLKETGKANNSLQFGGRYLKQEFSGSWMGQPFNGLGYLGYDNITGKHFSSWMDDASTSLFVAQGDYDEASRTYTYTGDMNDPIRGKVPFRWVLRVEGPDRYVSEMHETEQGKERKTAQIVFSRTK